MIMQSPTQLRPARFFLPLAACLLSAVPACLAQTNVLTVTPPETIKAKSGSTVSTKLTLQLTTGYHVNSNTPSEEYLIPIKLTWTPGALTGAEVKYPKAQMEKMPFADKPLSVYTGQFEIVTDFKVSPTALPGPTAISGKLRYQACNDRMCLAPKNIDVALQVDVVK
jgi:Disulphide bond corrector protein DsbC